MTRASAAPQDPTLQQRIAAHQQKRLAEIRTDQQAHAARGSRCPTSGDPAKVLALFDASRRAIGAAHPDKTWPCAVCRERTSKREAICWNCGTPRPDGEAVHL